MLTRYIDSLFNFFCFILFCCVFFQLLLRLRLFKTLVLLELSLCLILKYSVVKSAQNFDVVLSCFILKPVN